MCSASRKRWSYDMAVGFASVCLSVALFCAVSCSAQSTVQPGGDNTGTTTEIEYVTTLVLETNPTEAPAPVADTNRTTNPQTSPKTDGSPSNGNADETVPAGTTAPQATTTNSSATTPSSGAITTPVPSTVNCTSNCSSNGTSPTPSPTVSYKTDIVTVVPPAPEGTTVAPVQSTTQKQPETTSNTTTKVVTTKSAATTKKQAPPQSSTKTPTEKPATKTPVKPLTTGTKHSTTGDHDDHNVVPKKSTKGHKTAVVVTVVVFAIALVSLLGVAYVYRQRKLRNNYGRLSEETEDSGWSAFSKNPIYRGDRDYQPL